MKDPEGSKINGSVVFQPVVIKVVYSWVPLVRITEIRYLHTEIFEGNTS